MITLDQVNTALLKIAIDSTATLFKWLHDDTERFSNSFYSALRADFQAWQTAYAAGQLEITGANGVSQPLTGIDSVPIPPAR